MGKTLVSHSGLNLVGEMSMSVPSDDWCMKDSTTPVTIKNGSAIRTQRYRVRMGFSTRRSTAAPHSFPSMRALSPSRIDGLISTHRTIR